MLPRIIAVDWSGAATGAQRTIWLAEVHAPTGEVVRLERGRTREEMARHLADCARHDPRLVIGLDFAFSYPEWFLHQHRLTHAAEGWALAACEGERWLRECPVPFWGRPGRTRPAIPEHFRRTERLLPAVAGIRPKSMLQIGGAGAVGTGSIRGMPHLGHLRRAGCAIWPFHPARFPLVVEIYPRLLTGAVHKRNAEARAAHLDRGYPSLPASVRLRAGESEDAFDALCSAKRMAHSAHEFCTLPASHDATMRLEGEIWRPGLGARSPDVDAPTISSATSPRTTAALAR